MAAIVSFAACLAACDAMSTVTDGFKQVRTLESELEQSTGVKPRVGFNWHNGRLQSVTVIFPGLYETKPLRELAETVRSAVRKNFKQTPDSIVLGFAVSSSGSGTVAQAQ
jgi:hypothetical protein